MAHRRRWRWPSPRLLHHGYWPHYLILAVALVLLIVAIAVSQVAVLVAALFAGALGVALCAPGLRRRHQFRRAAAKAFENSMPAGVALPKLFELQEELGLSATEAMGIMNDEAARRAPPPQPRDKRRFVPPRPPPDSPEWRCANELAQWDPTTKLLVIHAKPLTQFNKEEAVKIIDAARALLGKARGYTLLFDGAAHPDLYDATTETMEFWFPLFRTIRRPKHFVAINVPRNASFIVEAFGRAAQRHAYLFRNRRMALTWPEQPLEVRIQGARLCWSDMEIRRFRIRTITPGTLILLPGLVGLVLRGWLWTSNKPLAIARALGYLFVLVGGVLIAVGFFTFPWEDEEERAARLALASNGTDDLSQGDQA